jgi:hypothetical protein
MDRILSKNTGFVSTLPSLVFTTDTEADISSLSEFNQIRNPIEEPRNNFFSRCSSYGDVNKRLKALIERADAAYIVDGFIRNAVDKHAEMFKDFDLKGGAKQIKFLKNRMNMLSLQSGEHWKTTISRYVNEYFKNGNPELLKVRRGKQPNTKRALYSAKPFPIAAIYLVSQKRLEPHIDNDKKEFVGWILDEQRKEPIKTTSGEPFDIKNCLITNSYPISTPGLLIPGLDLIHTAYKKGSDMHYGVGLVFASLEDISILRDLEQNVAVMIKKNSSPLLHYAVGKPSNPSANVQNQIDNVTRKLRAHPPDAALVTPDNHTVKMVGSESQALRVDPYLAHFTKRGFSGMGVSAFLMGFESGTMGAVDAAIELLMNRIRFCQEELSRDLEFFLLYELLYEGGFDPYTKEEDQVKLIFKEIDENRTTKLQNHFADLYAKESITFKEMRKLINMDEKVDEKDLYLNKVLIPKEKAIAAAKASTLGKTRTNNLEEDDSLDKKPISNELLKAQLLEILPETEEDLNYFLQYMLTSYNIDLYPLIENIRLLLGDTEAIGELVIDYGNPNRE